MKVLFISLAGIGDTLLTLPAMRFLKESKPACQVTCLTMLKGAHAAVAEWGCVDETIHFDFQKAGIVESLKFVWGLRKRKFDVSICTYPGNRLEYNAISWLIGANERIGHRYNHMAVRCGNWLHTRRVIEDDKASNIEENLRLVSLIVDGGVPNLPLRVEPGAQHAAFAQAWLDEHGLNGALLVGFHAGCDTRKNHEKRRWPVENFVALGRTLVEQAGARVLLFGGPEEAGLKADIVRGIGAGALSVDSGGMLEAAAIIARCTHFVTNDSGLMHLASALGVPTTVIYGPTNWLWLRNPACERNEVRVGLDCQPCFYYSPRHLKCKYGDFRCIHRLTPDIVAPVVLRALHNDTNSGFGNKT